MFWYVFIQFRGREGKQIVIIKRSGFQIGSIGCENNRVQVQMQVQVFLCIGEKQNIQEHSEYGFLLMRF